MLFAAAMVQDKNKAHDRRAEHEGVGEDEDLVTDEPRIDGEASGSSDLSGKKKSGNALAGTGGVLAIDLAEHREEKNRGCDPAYKLLHESPAWKEAEGVPWSRGGRHGMKMLSAILEIVLE